MSNSNESFRNRLMSDHTNAKYRKLEDNLVKAAELLNTHPENLLIYSPVPPLANLPKHRDRVISFHRLLDAPMVQTDRIHALGNGIFKNIGLALCEVRDTPGLRYVQISYEVNANSYSFTYIPKGSLFRIKRIWQRLTREQSSDLTPPVLSDGILESLVQNTIGVLRPRNKFKSYGVKARRGLILSGTPGNGKTMACRYIQRLCIKHNIDYGTITSAEIDKAYGNATLSALFNKYTVSFFDDIDISYLSRKGNGKMACTLLTFLDGMDQQKDVVRIFTTNEELTDLDPAFTRPGRIDKQFTFYAPDEDLRQRLIRTWPSSITDNISVDDLVYWSKGWSFAELENTRSILVSNYLMGDSAGVWNLRRACDEATASKNDHKPARAFGFANSN